MVSNQCGRVVSFLHEIKIGNTGLGKKMGRHICKDLPNILDEGEFVAGYLDEEQCCFCR